MIKQKGFTLIELLVVIAIIGILSSIVLTSLNVARQKGNIAAAQGDLHSMRTAFEEYLISGGHYTFPPNRDNCSACSNPCSASSWDNAVNALKSSGDMSNPPKTDPWGHPWCYDNNYKVAGCPSPTAIWSMGPNGSSESSVYGKRGDDIWIQIDVGGHC